MLQPSVSLDPTFDLEARRHIELVDRGDLHSHRGFTSTGSRIPVEYRTLSIHVESRVPDQSTGGPTNERHRVAVKEFLALEWHRLSVDEVLRRLAVSPKTGLETVQAQRRLQTHGRNIISPPRNNLWRKLLEWILGGFGSLLLTASIICFVAWKPLGNPKPNPSNLALAVVLLIVLSLQAIFNAWQDFSTSRVMASIKGMIPSDVLVLRDSEQSKLPARDLVPGDLVTINMGEKVPADLRLIEVSVDLQFDRSILTGESEPVNGRVNMTDENFLETRNIAMQGTLCVSGSGTGVVIQTGDRTVFGVIAKLSSMETKRLTTLQRELFRFVLIIAGLASLVSLLIVILWSSWLRRSFPDYINVPTLLIDVVSVMVAFIPEGLPVAVTLSLAKVAHTLGKHKIVCKSFSIVETLGSVNVLCSDKTGTLTQNVMHVENLAIFDLPFESKDFETILSNAEPNAKANLSQVISIGAICNAATFKTDAPTNEKHGGKSIVGNATDVAVLRFCDSLVSAEATRSTWVNVFRKSFNSKTKYMLQLARLSSKSQLNQGTVIAPLASWDTFEPGSFLLTVKGAPEVLLKHCSHILDPTGGPPIEFGSAERQRIAHIQERWSSQGQRVILLARRVIKDGYLEKYADRQPEDYANVVDAYMTDLIVIGLVGLIDPLKPDIKQTVSTCRGAGIRFFIVTGDHPTTALSIAISAGIITTAPHKVHHTADLSVEDKKGLDDIQYAKSIIITGAELEKLNQEQLFKLCQYEEIVFARTTPEQKLFIVNNFKSMGNVVAVTGDGVNDAPSLKAADCGVAMGDGSDVAKEAADLVLLGDFSSIITAIEYGRLVYDNLKKSVLYLLPAGSFSELMPIIFNIVFGLPQMLSNIQMIIICVATDVLPALSLCMEPPEHGLLLRKPRNTKTDRLADWRLLLQAYGFLGILESLCAMSMSFWFLQRKGIPFDQLFLRFQPLPSDQLPTLTVDIYNQATSVYFFTLVIMQWGNLLATRGRKLSIFQHTPQRNLYIFAAMPIALALAILFSYVPWFQQVFQTSGILVEYFFIPLTFALGLLLFDEVRKLFVRKYPKSFIAWLAW